MTSHKSSFAFLIIISRVFLFLCILLFNSLFAQSKVCQFEHISVEQGLSQSIVTSVIQDKEGYLWFGTENGLNRFDGYNISIFKHIPNDSSTISDNGIMCLFKDRKNNLWIGTDKGGLNKYSNRTGKFSVISINADFRNSKVNSIYDDKGGNLWVGTDRGLYKYHPEKKILTRYINNTADNFSLSNNTVKSVYVDDFNQVWVGTEDGLNCYDQNIQKFNRYFSSSDKSKSRIPISCIYKDISGNLWIGTYNLGAILFNKELKSYSFYKHNPGDKTSITSNDIRKIFTDHSGNLWIATGNGLNRLAKTSNSFIRYYHSESDPHSLSCNEIISIYEDYDGILWFGTFSGGVNKLDLRKEAFTHYKHNPGNPYSLSENYVTSICEDKSGTIWIGTNLKGLNRLDNTSGKFFHYLNTPGCSNCITQNTILSLSSNNSDALWIGTYVSGLDKFDIKMNSFTHFRIDAGSNSKCINSPVVYALAEEGDSVLWIGTRNGLNKLNVRTNTFIHFVNNPAINSISGNIILSLFLDSSGILWIGTANGGLNKFDTKNLSFTSYQNSHKRYSISSNKVISIMQDPLDNNYLWIGTDYGLNKFNKTDETFDCFKKETGLSDISVYSILSDNNKNIWLCTDKGISRYNPATGFIKNFTVEDGLQSTEFEKNACLKSSDGTFYFGGINGFNTFNPDSILENNYLPPVVITSIRKFNKDVKFDVPISSLKELHLTYKDYVISFEFASLSYARPDKNQYAYKLAGFDKEWIYTNADNRIATYTNLEPGVYTFKVKGSNNDGKWNTEEASLNIFIKPPYWENNYFRIAAAFILAMIIFLIVNSKIRRLKTEKLRQYQFSRQLIESQEQQCKRLSTELHDSLGQNLLVVKTWLDMYSSAEDKDKSELGKITDLVKESISEVKEISSNLHPHQLERLGLKKALAAMINKINYSGNIIINCEIDDIAGMIPPESEINIYRIIQESLNNILKHSDSKEAVVKIKTENGIIISIEDFGKGFDLSDKDTQSRFTEGLGLKSLQERCRLINAELQIESSPGKGTKIIVKI